MVLSKNGKKQKGNMEDFEKNVFINCPFDESYVPLLKVLLYITTKIGLNPRLSLERNDSAEVRLNKIKGLIEESKFSIHDLSRSKSTKEDEYSRLNMPFELGLDFGCKEYNNDIKYRNKKFLILEEEKYSTQKALSDMAGADCKCHKGDAEELVSVIRNWFSENNMHHLPSSSQLWDDYNIFLADLYVKLMSNKFKQKDIDNLPIVEFMRYIN